MPSASGTATLRTNAPGSTVSDPVSAVYTSGGGARGPFTLVAKTGDGIGRYGYPVDYGQPAGQSLIGDQGKGGLPDGPPVKGKEVTP